MPTELQLDALRFAATEGDVSEGCHGRHGLVSAATIRVLRAASLIRPVSGDDWRNTLDTKWHVLTPAGFAWAWSDR